jgi:hypothetical protein
MPQKTLSLTEAFEAVENAQAILADVLDALNATLTLIGGGNSPKNPRAPRSSMKRVSAYETVELTDSVLRSYHRKGLNDVQIAAATGVSVRRVQYARARLQLRGHAGRPKTPVDSDPLPAMNKRGMPQIAENGGKRSPRKTRLTKQLLVAVRKLSSDGMDVEKMAKELGKSASLVRLAQKKIGLMPHKQASSRQLMD